MKCTEIVNGGENCGAELVYRKKFIERGLHHQAHTCTAGHKRQTWADDTGILRQRRSGKRPVPETRKSVLLEAMVTPADIARIRAAGYVTDAEFVRWAILELAKLPVG